MLGRVGRGVRGISRRLIASYVLVTVVAAVLAELLVLGYFGPRLVTGAQLQAQVQETAQSYWVQLAQHYPGHIPDGALLGQPDQPIDAGADRAGPGGTLAVPAVRGRSLAKDPPVTTLVAVARDGTVIASSDPSRFPAGKPATDELPTGAFKAVTNGLMKGLSGASAATPYGRVLWTLYGGAAQESLPPRALAFLYVQAPEPTGFVNPIRAWNELTQMSGSEPLDVTLLLIAIVPIGVLCGLFASRRLMRRVRRLERATVAVTDGDYALTLPSSGRDDVGRLEANFAAMTRQLRSALAAERERATNEARAAERSRIAREIHDAISQHLFGLRMIASGMRRADPGNEQVVAIERITEDALRDMQALLRELRPPGLEGTSLAPALEEVCAAYRDRLGLVVDADVANVSLPEPIEDALLRVTQEACTNAVRHGDARRLSVSMGRQNGHVELAVRDDGAGFDPSALGAGSGLQHIRDRVSELGGTVDIDSAPGAGAAVTVRVPVR